MLETNCDGCTLTKIKSFSIDTLLSKINERRTTIDILKEIYNSAKSEDAGINVKSILGVYSLKLVYI